MTSSSTLRTFFLFYFFLFFHTVVNTPQPRFDTLLQDSDTLLQGFINPPGDARPRVWWHWMNGNITREGIRKDLLWMHRSGIGGFQLFEAALSTPQIVEQRLPYLSPEWKDAIRYAANLADSLQLEMAIAGSPGWSESGGPWVPVKDAMKKLVWSEVRVKGGLPFTGSLPQPPATIGAFQNQTFDPGYAAPAVAPPPQFYEDVTVVAYRLPADDVPLSDLHPKVTSSADTFTLAQLTDGDLATTRLLPADPENEFAWIQYAFERPQTIKAVSVVGGRIRMAFEQPGASEDLSLEASTDGVHFRRITFIPPGGVSQQTIAIPPTTARYFRVTFKNPPPLPSDPTATKDGDHPKPPAGTYVGELVLHTAARISRFEEKAGFGASNDLDRYPTPAAGGIAEGEVMDLTGRMNADGILNWTPPPGNWKIVRFGYSLTGKKNHPASPEATGWEVDKLDARAVRDYFEKYLNQYKEATGGMMGTRGLQYMVTDSWEAGQENWTPGMPEEFQRRRGYPLLPWMPVLTGQIVKSTEASERFLWDYRKTISELVTEHHYDQLTTILDQYGMKRYSEAHEHGRALVADGMDVKRTAAIPMSAMWESGNSFAPMAEADIRESASVAHIYGQNRVAAESLTAMGLGGKAWSYAPEHLKPTADLELASGLNRFVIHTSVHQPVDDKVPGLGLGPFGQWFNRHETWAEQAKAWTDYLARSSYMLQQGRFVADVVYYYGEDNNITSLFGAKLPDVPPGYNFDFINAHALLNLLTVQNGRLVTPGGMSYRVLALDSNARHMSLEIARKIRDLVRGGAVVTGPRPVATTGLKGDQPEFNAIVNEVWGSGNERVHTGKTLKKVLSVLNIPPDFYNRGGRNMKLLYVHRQLAKGHIFWVNSRSDRNERVEASFRVSGMIPRIWHPETGATEAASYTIANGRTNVILNLVPNDAVFVVFQSPVPGNRFSLPQKIENRLEKLAGRWDVSFPPGRGAPVQATFDQLGSWTENPDPGIQYFSGTATYTKIIRAPAKWFGPGTRLFIDLGEVKNLAEVIVNGNPVGTVWKKPFRVDVTRALKAGENRLEIKVTNLWVNRLIGDQQPGIAKKITYTTIPFYQPDSPLLPSGLLGPVRILSIR